MRPIRAGTLRHRITIEHDVEVDDGHAGQKLQATVLHADVPASVEPLSGNEAVVARQLQDTITHKITLRWRPGIKARMRVRLGERRFNIREVRNVEERNRALELRVEEGGPA